jgi:putative PEP-CTERM system histidine kinase
MQSLELIVGSLGFAAATVLYAVVVALTWWTRQRADRFNGFAMALLVALAWAALATFAIWSSGPTVNWLPFADAVHSAAWVCLMAGMLGGAAAERLTVRLRQVLVIGTAALVGLVGYESWGSTSSDTWSNRTALVPLLMLPLLGLFSLEQIFRNAEFRQRWALRPLALGLGTVFAIDVFVYADAVLFGTVNSSLWFLRGLVNAVAAPFLLLAAKRQPTWERELFVSRHVVFYTASVAGAGAYLVAMGLGGFLIGARGGAWGPVLQAAFLVSAGGVFLYALFSAAVRRRLRVFIAKNFYRNRYDYREEWLRLMKTLAGSEHRASLSERCVQALADIIGSQRGELWFAARRGSAFESRGAFGMPPTAEAIARDDLLARFLETTRWVVDTREYAEDPEKYANAFASAPHYLAAPSIFVPLILEDEIAGVVRLERPLLLGPLTFEDHDLLRTAGQQVAIFLAQERAQEELAETRQFEAFSKLTAFLMHDLKNLLAQQELLVGNARRFKHRPEFIDDAISTLDASVARMKGVLERLQGATGSDRASRVDLAKLLAEVCNSCADRHPAPQFRFTTDDVRVEMDREKLNMALAHAIRNAQDATPADGRIDVRLTAEGGQALIEVADTGMGMAPEFVRDRLFRPFDSTKGAKGMGIGAYQIRETLRVAGGDVDVSSEIGKGTIVRMRLPLAQVPGVAKKAGAHAP